MRKYPIKALLPIFLAALFLLNTPNVLAAETDGMSPSEPPAVTESVTDSGSPAPAPDWDEVGSLAELTEWMESHAISGGAARLTNDIELPADERYLYSSAGAYSPTLAIDVGEHTIYVSGHLELLPQLAFSGKGGKNGIFHVRQGGRLELSSYSGVLSVRAEEDYAIYQEDGAFLGCYTDAISGEIRYPALPVAWPFSDVSEFYGHIEDFPVMVLPLEGEFDTAEFPQTIASYLCKEGLHSYDPVEIPVAWDFEKYAEQLAARKRFVITGEYTGDVAAMVQPACLVTFLREDASVFLQCSANKKAEDKLDFAMRIKLDDPSMVHRLEWSTDGESWQRANAEEIDDDDDSAEGDEYMFWWCEENEGAVRYDGTFCMAELPRYFSIATTDAEGHTTYSDTIYLDGDDKVAGWDNGGNRHGGGGITPPELPPLGGGADDTTPDEPDGTQPPTKPKPPAQSTPPVIETPIPALVTDPPAAAAVEPTSPHAGQTEDGTTTSTASFAQPEPSQSASSETADARAAMAPVASETEAPARKSAAPNAKAVAQVATGVAATGGIITLTMTWGRWSKRLISLLRKLLK